ncbi:MAG: sulfatase [Candidatus Binatia bacterium]|nr:sulfatase [Candidatus Binatia bacterium]
MAPGRRTLALLGLCAIVLAACTDPPPNAANDVHAGATKKAAFSPAQPNVLLIIVDTLRADRLPTYGFPAGRTPSLDELTHDAVVFERAIAASASTVPSHASMFTSRFVRQHAVGYRNGDTALRNEPTLAEAFRDAGYATAAFISNVMLRSTTGLNRGFDFYDENLPTEEPNRPLFFERDAALTTKRAIRWLERERDKPVFLVVHYQDPHGPYTPPEQVLADFPAAPVADEPTLPVNSTQSGFRGLPSYQAIPGLDQPSQYERRYAAEILYTDRWMAKLLRAFDSQDPNAEHVVLFTADHGESLGEEEHWFEHGHTSMPDIAHIPFVLRAPGIPPARRPEPVSQVDILPTLLELAQIDVPTGTAGIALGPYLRSGEPLPARELYCDIGLETAIYEEGGFTRLRFPSYDSGHRGDISEIRVERYDWPRDQGWRPATAPTEVSDETRRYLSRVTPLHLTTTPPDRARAARLRALGYLEPELPAKE